MKQTKTENTEPITNNQRRAILDYLKPLGRMAEAAQIDTMTRREARLYLYRLQVDRRRQKRRRRGGLKD